MRGGLDEVISNKEIEKYYDSLPNHMDKMILTLDEAGHDIL